MMKINIKDKKHKKIKWYGYIFLYAILPEKIINIFKKSFIKKIFQIQKGFDIVNEKYSDSIYFDITEKFVKKSLNIKENQYSKLIFGKNIKDKEKIIKQYLLKYIYHPLRSEASILRSILLSANNKKALIFPMNKNICKITEEKNIKVNHFFSLILWEIFIISFFFRGSIKIFSLFLKLFSIKKTIFYKSVYFINLPKEALNLKNNLKSTNKNYFSFIFSYLKKNNIKTNQLSHSVLNIKNFKHFDTNYIYSEKYNFNLGFFKKLKLISWGIRVILISFIDLIRGRWWNPLLLYESVDRKIIEIIRSQDLHSIYLFNNTSGLVYKPMWTYEAEKKDSIVIFYFYSLNYLPYTSKLCKPEGMSIFTWNNFAVWNKDHELQLRNNINHSFNSICFEPVFFDTGYLDFKQLNQNFVTLFDITPLRPTFRKCNFIPNYFKGENLIKFLKDIIEISEKINLKIVLKIKRLSSLTDKNYINYINKQIARNKIYLLDDQTSSISLIKKSKFVISYPITSANKICDYFNITNYYYCPIDNAFNKQKLLGSKIIYKKDDLKEILFDYFKD